MKLNWHSGLALMIAGLFANVVSASVLPPNDLAQFDRRYHYSSSEAELAELADRFYREFSAMVAVQGAELKLELFWNSSDVNAYASQKQGKWVIAVHGGLARRPELTFDALTLMLCHELGHHLAGYPFYYANWVATEGQADYWGAQVCVRRLWRNERDLNEHARLTATKPAKQSCDTFWQTRNEQNICYRTAEAALSVTLLFANNRDIQATTLKKRDISEISSTKSWHPEPQCRLETYIAGALCVTRKEPIHIPGKDSTTGKGINSPDSELDALDFSCAEILRYKRKPYPRYGARPTCWFKPLTARGAGKENIE
jgi:hypothetical protein